MKKLTAFLCIVLSFITVFVFIGCGSKQVKTPDKPVVSPQATREGMEVQVPEWFANPPSDPNYLYAPATIKSTDMGHAVEQARQAGRDEIARQISTKVTSMMKRFQEETGADEDAEFLSMTTTVSKSISSEVINGSKSVQQKIYKEGTRSFRAYVLIELPIGAMNNALVDKVKENKNMYTRFRASQAFKELEEESEKYEQFKKEQTPGGSIPQ